MSGSILIKDATIVTANRNNEIIKNGSVLIENGEIIDVGKHVRATGAEFVIDGKDRIVLPGLINTHVHLAQGILRGLVPDNVALIKWLKDWVWPLQGNIDKEIMDISTKLTLLEMINSGTSAFVATSVNARYDVDRTVENVYKSGMRAAIGKQIMDTPGYADQPQILHQGLIEDASLSFKIFDQMYKKWHGKDNRIWMWFSPRTPGAVSDELFRKIAEAVREYKSGVTMHLAEVRDDIRYFAGLGKTPGRFLKDLGMVGRNFVYVHGVWLNEDDMEIFAKSGTSVSHNPSSNSKLGSGIAPVTKMLSKGVNVTIGTDGGPSNDDYDIIREMKLALLLQKVNNLDPQAISVLDIIKMATINGAWSMGIEQLTGSIEKGKRADIAIFNLRAPHLVPSVVPISNLIYSGTGMDCMDLIVDGKFLKKDGKVVTVNEEEVYEKSNTLAAELLSRANLKEWT
jgi:cytosine/adenosine deaminase-related metal-dependent hydrolase